MSNDGSSAATTTTTATPTTCTANINKLLCIYNYYRSPASAAVAAAAFSSARVYLSDTLWLSQNIAAAPAPALFPVCQFRTCKLKNYLAVTALSVRAACCAVSVAAAHDKAQLTKSWRPLLIRRVGRACCQMRVCHGMCVLVYVCASANVFLYVCVWPVVSVDYLSTLSP